MGLQLPDENAIRILNRAGMSNYACVAVCWTGTRWLVAANGFSLDPQFLPKSMSSVQTELLALDDRFHAEMRIVNVLMKGIAKDGVRKSMFSSLYIGVSKEVCCYCRTVLDFLGIGHREAHNRVAELDHWDCPPKLEGLPEFSEIYNTRAEQEDSDYVPD